MELSEVDERDLVGLDVYSADGILAGRVEGYVQPTPADEAGFERDTSQYRPPERQERYLVVNGTGMPLQAIVRLPIEDVTVDWPGRRIMLRQSMLELEEAPRHDPDRDGAIPFGGPG